ncbi:TolB family protein [Thalassobellus sediminis]|uniref:TolB family protein n=1 Tax=Thalassobellus sediminis TaxID=3367753 RepID=UPI0037BBD62E
MINWCCVFIFFIGIISYSQTENYTVINHNINTEYPHFGLMRVGKKILFTSYLLDKKGRLKRFQGSTILTIFEGDVASSGNIESVKLLEIDSKQNIPQITSATKSADGKLLYISTLYTFKNRPKGDFKDTNFHIAVGEYKEGVGWTNFKVLPFCKPKYSYTHPSLSKDGNVLYFTANLRGGKETTKGGSDIFKVDVLGANTFSEPKNLGSEVNSYSKDMFPVIADDNTLYFASNRPNGFGGFDIYKSIMNTDGTFGKAEKLPKPINSNKDDFSFIMNQDNVSGYFSSKREKGKGDDDVYYFKLN